MNNEREMICLLAGEAKSQTDNKSLIIGGISRMSTVIGINRGEKEIMFSLDY